MTPAGNVVILAIIASLNAVWGYPLVGLLASLFVLMGICGAANWLFRPRLRAVIRLPEMVSSHSVVDVSLTLENLASFPAFDLSLLLVELPSGWTVRSAPEPVSELDPNLPVTIRYTIQVAGRGDFQWPALKCVSTFPFSLFRSQQTICFGSSNPSHGGRTLVTPAIVESDVRGFVQSLLARGTQAGGLRSGDSLEYLGSREYNHGDTVRRWDFASWARLGRPIVRQFDQFSTSNITIVVDTFLEEHQKSEYQSDLETRLSMAASIVDSLKHTACKVHLILPTNHDFIAVCAEASMQSNLLRPLAVAKGIRANDSRGRRVNQRCWLQIASTIDADSPVICIMASITSPVAQDDHDSAELDRKHFLDRVASFTTSLVVVPGAENRLNNRLSVSHV